MKLPRIATTAWALCAAAGVIVGCSEAVPRDTLVSSHPAHTAAAGRRQPAAEKLARITAALDTKPISRSEGVPFGVLTASGLTVPRGFAVNLFADNLTNPRRITIAPGGTPEHFDAFVAESRANRLRVLRAVGRGVADQNFVFTTKLDQPYGIAFHPSGYVYVGNTDSIVRFPYKHGSTSKAAEPERIARLTGGGYNQHWTRNLLFSPDAQKLFVTVGSSCNTCEEEDPQRAAISVMNADGSHRHVYASGLRNPVGMAWRPGSRELWTVVNERDRLGDDLPPDYLTRVAFAAFYGWPYAYPTMTGKDAPDPKFGTKDPGRLAAKVAPSVPLQAHSAALGVAFYPAAPPPREGQVPAAHHTGKPSRFPHEFEGDAFLSFHGSWNRSVKTGYKIVRVKFHNGRPVAVGDFVTGFLREGGAVWGRPVDVTVAPDGSLLFTDDMGGKVWRVTYVGAASQPKATQR